jgi:hypothetical protein
VKLIDQNQTDDFDDILKIVDEFSQLTFQHRMFALTSRRHRRFKVQNFVDIASNEATTKISDVDLI